MSDGKREDATTMAPKPNPSTEKISSTAPIAPPEAESQARPTESDPHSIQSQYAHLTPHQQQQHGIYHGMNSMSVQPGPFNMGQMNAALPDYGSQHMQTYPRQVAQSGQRPMAGPSAPAVVYQIQQNIPYAPAAGYAPQPMYGNFVQPPYAHGYAQSPASPHTGYTSYSPGHPRPAGLSGSPQFGQAPVPFYYYADVYGRPAMSPTGYNAPPARSGRSSHSAADGHGHTHIPFLDGTTDGEISGSKSKSSDHGTPNSAPRGPPRKPKQSGHALWVGNLPPSATIMSLKEHFSRDFSRDIESLFLISKSNCAFVNYRSEEACTKAMQQFHDSRFEGVRLVCRLRKGSGAASGAPTGPAAMAGSHPSLGSSSRSKSPVVDNPEDQSELANGYTQATDEEYDSPTSKSSDHYFILKSLTLQDLEQSVRTQVWATQTHNEEAMNRAYKSAQNVYLIFSANKSGEYFGYARMASSISQDATETLGPIKRIDASDMGDAPKTIATLATEYSPRGHVIDDSSRGTIFWEAEYSDDEQEEAASETGDAETEPTWGKPFKIEWKSTTSVPFYRTRGLRNPWNANREVKIARDGTELEPGVGDRLIRLFHPPGSASMQSSS